MSCHRVGDTEPDPKVCRTGSFNLPGRALTLSGFDFPPASGQDNVQTSGFAWFHRQVIPAAPAPMMQTSAAEDIWKSIAHQLNMATPHRDVQRTHISRITLPATHTCESTLISARSTSDPTHRTRDFGQCILREYLPQSRLTCWARARSNTDCCPRFGLRSTAPVMATSGRPSHS